MGRNDLVKAFWLEKEKKVNELSLNEVLNTWYTLLYVVSKLTVPISWTRE